MSGERGAGISERGTGKLEISKKFVEKA